jgi:hypothetical protein
MFISVGLFRRWTLTIGGLLLVALIFGIAFRSDWPTVGIQMIYSITYYLLLVNRSDNGLSVDGEAHWNVEYALVRRLRFALQLLRWSWLCEASLDVSTMSNSCREKVLLNKIVCSNVSSPRRSARFSAVTLMVMAGAPINVIDGSTLAEPVVNDNKNQRNIIAISCLFL